MHKTLEEIINKTKEDLSKRKQQVPVSVILIPSLLRENDNVFRNAIRHPKSGKIAIIAEIKLASPTHPYLGSKEQIISRVKQYGDAGADAVSVITEKHFFKGSPSFIKIIKNTVSLPILQKDFVIDEYQIVESKYLGADAILLIAKILDQRILTKFVKFAQKLGIEPVVEVNSEDDFKKAIATKTRIIAVNARDLDTLKVDVDRVCKILKKVPDRFIKLGFSGIHSRVEVEKYKQAGANGVLIGTSLMKAEDINQYLQHLRGEESIVKVKICGIRSMEAAKTAIDAGADFLGFNFVPASKRYIDPAEAAKIINSARGTSSALPVIPSGARNLPTPSVHPTWKIAAVEDSLAMTTSVKDIKIVGVFRDAGITQVNRIASGLNLDFVQLHGNEDNKYINNVCRPVIKSITIDSQAEKVKADYLLLDRAKRGKGRMPDFKKAAQLVASYRVFYAGGLDPDNVVDVIRKVSPFAVDVAGGIETNGHQDLEKIKLFISRTSCHSERSAKNLFKKIDCHVARRLVPRNDNCEVRKNAKELI